MQSLKISTYLYHVRLSIADKTMHTSQVIRYKVSTLWARSGCELRAAKPIVVP